MARTTTASRSGAARPSTSLGGPIIRRTVPATYNSGVLATQSRNKINDVRVENTFLSGGGCSVNINERDDAPPNTTTIQPLVLARNTFVKGSTTQPNNANCAMIVTEPTRSAPTTIATGNRWSDGIGVPVISQG